MAESSTNGKPTGHDAALAETHLAVVTHESADEAAASQPADADGDADVLAVGTKVGRYLVVERLGAGAMGVVYAAYDPKLDRKIALKLLRPRAGGDSAHRTARLEREAQGLAKLSHPNVVGIFDVGVHDAQVFLAMEFLGGGTLRAWLAETRRPWREVLAMFTAVGRGLAAAHAEGLIHRDFKPDNVLLDKAGNPKVVDFGLVRLTRMGDSTDGESGEVASGQVASDARPPEPPARPVTAGSAGLTRTGAMTGTPAYMAAEQFLGQRIDARTDQFAFCVSLYEALAGERPFAGERVMQLADAVTTGRLREPPKDTTTPAWLRRVVVRGLGAKPDTRWPSMGELIAALEDDPAIKARRRLIVGGTIAVVVATVLGALQTVRHRHAQTEEEIARNVAASERESNAARTKAIEAKNLRERAFAAFDAMDRDGGEASWRQSRALIPTVDGAFDRAATALEMALTLDAERGDLRDRLADLHVEHTRFAEETHQDSKVQVLAQRLAAVDLDGSRRKTLAAEAVLQFKTRPEAPDAKMTLQRYDRDTMTGRRTLVPVVAPATTSVLRLPAGSYRLSLNVKDRAPVTYPIAVDAGERLSVELWLPPANAVPAGFVYVPPGRFWFGDADEKLRTQFLDTVPMHRRTTEAYLIARTETTYADWIAFLDALDEKEREQYAPRITSITRGSLRLSGGGGTPWRFEFQPTVVRFSARAGADVVYPGRNSNARQNWLMFPVTGISTQQAERYFTWLRQTKRVPGARLCSELEWERAARGADERGFPHGDELLPDDANVDVTYGRVDSAFGPDMVGIHPASRSPFDVDDLAGNVLELVGSALRPDEIVMRGGAYFFNTITARSTNRNAVSKTFQDVATGFRVCASIEGEN